MIAKLVSFALRQRFLIVIASLALMVWGAFSFQKLPIDAYPDLSPPHVEIITQWPGHAAEEVERLISIPNEIEMNGIPRLEALRSISLYGLSAIEMNFEYGADPYFVREQAFERMANASVPSGLQPTISPLFSPSGLIYRYVVQSPDRAPQDLKVIEDWVLERHYRSIQGVADDSGFGGADMQYQVLLDPTFDVDMGRNPPITIYIGFSVNIPLRIFDKNQGEKLRTEIDINHAQRQKDAAEAQVFSDVDSAYFTVVSSVNLLLPYKGTDGYLETASRIRDAMSFAYQHGHAALLDYLDAQRDYRATQVAYINLVGSYLSAASQLNTAVGREVIQ